MNTADVADRIAARANAAGIVLTAIELDQLAKYYELLTRWNQRVNLTSIDLESLSHVAVDRIITEPVVAKGLIADKSGVWFDLGSGGGSPALPLKILRPLLKLTLVESKSKKSAFLREAVRHLGLDAVTVWTGRIEDLVKAFPARTVQLVTVRGVKIDQGLLETSEQLLVNGGHLIAFGTPTPPATASAFQFQTTVYLPDAGSAIHLFEKL